MKSSSPLWLRILRILRDGWRAFGHGISAVIGAVLLTILWIVVFGVYAIVGKIMRLFAKPKASGWHDGVNTGRGFLRFRF